MASTLRRLPAVAAAAAVAVAVTSLGAGPADAADRAPTRIKTSYDADTDVLKVRVSSDRAACERKRLVVVYADTGGEQLPAASFRTNRRGVVEIEVGLSGKVVAVATRTADCEYAQSRPLKVSQPVEEQ